MATESGIEHDDYLQQISPGGTPSLFSKPLALLTLFHQQ